MKIVKDNAFSENVFFVTLLLIVFLVGMSVFVVQEKDISRSENRRLTHFRHFVLDDFLYGVFQENFEQAISDQFLFSEEIRVNYQQAVSNLPSFGIKDKICQNRYIKLSSNDGRERGIFNCEDYIIYLPERLSGEKKEIIEENIVKYNHLNELSEVYYYFVDDPSSIDFSTGTVVNDYYDLLKQKLIGAAGIGKLDNDSYEKYKKLFYKTDHHWDYRGSYQGFLDIASMLKVKHLIKPIEASSNNECFYGSYARTTNNYDYCEEFSFYNFQFPEHDTIINGKNDQYNHFDDYIAHNYIYDRAENYYAYVYGIDYGEIMFDFHQPTKENLLIISNSYSNALNELLAQFFNRTYVIDLRDYKETYGSDFRPGEYIKNKKINKVLVLMNPTFIWAREPNRGLEL